MSFFPPITIASIIQKIDFQQLLLPAIQREFVWTSEQIEALFDSLIRGYPIGSLLLWKVEGDNRTNHRYYSTLKNYRERYNTHCIEANTSALPTFEAILDGQQRLTALYIGLKGTFAYKKPNVNWKDNEKAIPTRKLYLNLTEFVPKDDIEGELPDDGRLYDFRFLSLEDLAELNNKNWFEVGRILALQGTFKLNNYIKENGWSQNERANETLSKLHDMVHVKPIINYYLEADQDYDKALNIFIRINSGGEPLDYSDLIMSTTISGWEKKDARYELNNLRHEIRNSFGFDISKDLILRSYLLLFSTDIKFRVNNFSIKNAREFEANWTEIREAISTAFELIHDFGYSEKNLTSNNAALPIIYYLLKTNKVKDFTKKIAYKEDRDLIRKWLHAVLLHGIFGGQADGVLKIIRDVVAKSLKENADVFPAKAIAARLSSTSKSITVDDEFIENLMHTQYEDRYAFPILALLYPHLDYRNGDFHKDHLHPISGFSKKNLKAQGVDTDQPDCYYVDTDYTNGIVNLQMLDSNENKSKNKSDLKIWVDAHKIDLNKQVIPNILEFKDFVKFVDERWEMIKKKLEKELTF